MEWFALGLIVQEHFKGFCSLTSPMQWWLIGLSKSRPTIMIEPDSFYAWLHNPLWKSDLLLGVTGAGSLAALLSAILSFCLSVTLSVCPALCISSFLSDWRFDILLTFWKTFVLITKLKSLSFILPACTLSCCLTSSTPSMSCTHTSKIIPHEYQLPNHKVLRSYHHAHCLLLN